MVLGPQNHLVMEVLVGHPVHAARKLAPSLTRALKTLSIITWRISCHVVFPIVRSASVIFGTAPR